MRLTVLTILIGVLTLTLFPGCRRKSDDVSVPRRYAYPRPELYSPDYKTFTSGQLTFDINSNARPETDSLSTSGSRWLTFRYPRYNADIYLTLTPVTHATLDGVLDNRLQRMAMNIHSNNVKQIDPLDNAPFRGMALYAPSGTSTPVQFISTDSCRWVVSGAVFMHDTAVVERNDSVRPVIESIMDDVQRLLTSIKEK